MMFTTSKQQTKPHQDSTIGYDRSSASDVLKKIKKGHPREYNANSCNINDFNKGT